MAAALIDGRLVATADPRHDPLALARTTIYVPTQRAARQLRATLAEQLGTVSRFLPVIRPLGEFDEASAFFLDRQGFENQLVPPADPLDRQLLLAVLVRLWAQTMPERFQRLYPNEPVWSPASDSDAVWMAGDLAALLDSFAAQGLDLASIAAAREADVGEWSALSADFLAIVQDHWPAMLQDRQRVDPGQYRNQLIRAEAARLKALQPTDPVIVAGSTGSMAATADLIATIAGMPNAAVVLPGFDRTMPDSVRAVLEATPPPVSAVSHPQYGMVRLIGRMGATPTMIEPLGEPEKPRAAWLSTALQPAETTSDWAGVTDRMDASTWNDVAVLEAANDAEEAAAIASAIRVTLHDPGATVALVTPDRTLARRVCAELQRFAITAVDSAGQPFMNAEHGRFLRLMLDTVFAGGEPATLLALTKHPLFRLGEGPETLRETVSLFERLVMRGTTGRYDAAATTSFAEDQISKRIEQEYGLPRHLRAITPDDFVRVQAFCARLHDALAPLAAFRAIDGDRTLPQAAHAMIESAEALARDADGDVSHLYAGSGGTVLAGFLESMVAAATDFAFTASELPAIVTALANSRTVRDDRPGHPRVHVWGALEARLQCVDTMIMAGLNEGVWPSNVQNDAFLTRGQKDLIGLEAPERRIGLAAHDFQMGMGHAQVILSRSLRSDGSPTVASRWLQRLLAITPKAGIDAMKARGRHFVTLAASLRQPEAVPPVLRPAPVVPVAMRPTHFSFTEIATLRRDPYAIFARRVLDLSPFDELVRDPDSAERGRLLHDIMERAVSTGLDFGHEDAAAQLLALATRAFDEADLPAEVRAIWWPRFENAVETIIEWERERAAFVTQRLAEARARATAVEDTGCTLGGRADRLDLRTDGRIDIIDYKTGSVPEKKDVKTLREAQLPLEAAVARRGAFADVGARETADLIHLKFATRDAETHVVPNDQDDGTDLAQTAWERLTTLLRAQADPERGYLSHAVPVSVEYTRPYDHLARLLEWSSEEGDEGEGTGTAGWGRD